MNRISLITGVSRDKGLGYETAKQLSELGHQVIITARDIEKVKSLADKTSLTAMQLDVTTIPVLVNLQLQLRNSLAN